MLRVVKFWKIFTVREPEKRCLNFCWFYSRTVVYTSPGKTGSMKLVLHFSISA